MTRREAREAAFALLFDNTFSTEGMEAVIADAAESELLKMDDFSVALAKGAAEKQAELDQRIEAASHKWKMQRISRVSLAVMRLATYEVLYALKKAGKLKVEIETVEGAFEHLAAPKFLMHMV